MPAYRIKFKFLNMAEEAASNIGKVADLIWEPIRLGEAFTGEVGLTGQIETSQGVIRRYSSKGGPPGFPL